MKTAVLESILTSLQACNFIKKRLQHRCFPANIFKNSFFVEHLRLLLLRLRDLLKRNCEEILKDNLRA